MFSARILEIQIKFLCDCCGNKIRVDARLQGMMRDCPVCDKPTKVPEWGGSVAGPAEAPARATVPMVRLSAEECEFLSTPMNDSGRTLATAAGR